MSNRLGLDTTIGIFFFFFTFSDLRKCRQEMTISMIQVLYLNLKKNEVTLFFNLLSKFITLCVRERFKSVMGAIRLFAAAVLRYPLAVRNMMKYDLNYPCT